MSKRKAAAYSCVSCGHNEAKWLGRCPVCGEWNTFHEKHISRKSETKRIPELLSAIDPSPPEMHPTGIDELDRVLGGGLAPGASVLIGGEPGIGKSTLMLQGRSLHRRYGSVCFGRGNSWTVKKSGRSNEHPTGQVVHTPGNGSGYPAEYP